MSEREQKLREVLKALRYKLAAESMIGHRVNDYLNEHLDRMEALLAEPQPAPDFPMCGVDSLQERAEIAARQPAPPSLSAINAEWHRRVKELESAAICEFHDKPKNFCGTCANELVEPGQKAMEELVKLEQLEAEIRDRASEEAAQLCEAQVEAILCGDVYDINDDPDTPKLTAAINAQQYRR